jgi:hypothetical protein
MPENEPSVDGRSLLLPDLPSGGPGTAKAKTKKPRQPRARGPKPGTEEWWARWLRQNYVPEKSNNEYDIWRCTSCGAPLIYARTADGRHGGPSERMLDRRYGMTACWRVSEGGWPTSKASPHGRGERVLVRHDSRPQSEQPTQSSSLKRLTGGSPRSVANYGKVPGSKVRFTRTISVGETVRVPCVEPRGAYVVIAPASTDIDPPSFSDTPPSRPDEWSGS